MRQPSPSVSTRTQSLAKCDDFIGWHEMEAKLQSAGLRATRPRIALGLILFAKGDRHVTAEMLYAEAKHAKVKVSMATVYNTLHQFINAGLLRQVAVEGSKTFFDTNNSEHQ